MEKIYRYIEEHASVPNQALEWVVKQTHIRTNHARMLSGAAQGQLLRMRFLPTDTLTRWNLTTNLKT